ncbi:hypothetical protein GT972_10880 [Sinimarinibacterium sp. NLF-5-8]|nr:hypothetical protein [Sinimarinibacterium sp. NLF-5-8]QHS10585.1 hypothetical protein GT972_10880 [Sinimarinibacterium sp. NLF-5-8]
MTPHIGIITAGLRNIRAHEVAQQLRRAAVARLCLCRKSGFESVVNAKGKGGVFHGGFCWACYSAMALNHNCFQQSRP